MKTYKYFVYRDDKPNNKIQFDTLDEAARFISLVTRLFAGEIYTIKMDAEVTETVTGSTTYLKNAR